MAAGRILPVLALVALAILANPEETSGAGVLEVAEDYGAASFVSFARKCAYLKNLLETSTQPGGFTLFAFSEKAYSESPPALRKLIVNNTQTLQWVLEYHVALGPYMSSDIKDNLLLTSLYPSPTSGASLPLQYLRTNIYTILSEAERERLGTATGKVVTAGGAPIVQADLPASNGIVHIIDKVMFPLPTGADMTEFVNDDGRFSSLFGFLQKANLTKALETDPSQPLTLFAPNNQAFKNLPKSVVQKLANVTFLQQVLEYHVVPGAYYAAGLWDNQILHPLYNKPLLVERGQGGIYLQNSKVLQADNTVSNGVVHEISAVLIPPK